MNLRLIMLLALSLAPWVYLGLVSLSGFRSSMNGFELLPFGALLFAKQLALQNPKDRARMISTRHRYRTDALHVSIAILLVIALVTFGAALRNSGEVVRTGILVAAGIAIATLVSWDVRRIFRIAGGPTRDGREELR